MSSTETEHDRAVYRSLKCHRCGGKLEACEFDDILDMRIDGQLRKVAVRRVPCMRCLNCKTAITDGTADEVIMYYVKKYLVENNMDTTGHKFRRWVRRVKGRIWAWHWNRSPWAKWLHQRERRRWEALEQ